MPVALEVTVHPTILPQRCRPRESLPKNPAPRNSGPRKQSRPMARPLLHPALMSPSSLLARKRRRSIGRRSRTGKTLLRPPGTTPLRVRKAIGSAIIARRRAILWEIARNLQKTSVGLGNLRAGAWWWWRGCQGALHLLSGSISGRPKAERSGVDKGLAW